ncbi:hypothetical protein BH23BAC2_BH23BAC2_21790 [soil metagenome]
MHRKYLSPTYNTSGQQLHLSLIFSKSKCYVKAKNARLVNVSILEVNV